MPCIKRIFPEAVKTFKTAPQHLKDVWFNEFKKRHEWDPNDEGTVRLIFEKKAARLLADALCEVRTNLASGDAVPGWISDPVLAQYQLIWNSNEFKKISEKNKRNRNSDCEGIGPSLHTAGSIPITEHRRRLEAVTNLKQTQPQVAESAMWLEATGGLHIIKQLEEQNQVMQQQQQDMHEENRRIRDIIQKMEATLAQFTANLGSLDQDPNKNSSNDDTLPPSTSDDDTLAPSSQD
nr:putative transposase En/Spm [Ipomoea batatas]